MNDEDHDWERRHLEISPYSLNVIKEQQSNSNLPEEEDPFLQTSYSSEDSQVNFTHGEAARCLDALVSHQDLQSARERIGRNRDKGRMRQELINGIKKLSSGNLFLAGVCEVGQEVQQRLQNNTQKAHRAEQEVYERASRTYLKLFLAAFSIRQNKPDWKTWKNSDLTVVLNTLKRKSDGSLPKKKADLVATYKVWSSGRSPFSFCEYCKMNNVVIPEGQSDDLDNFFDESDSDNENENVENQVAVSLLELAGSSQSI